MAGIHQNTISGQGLNRCPPELKLTSPAKINLGLRIVGRRADGLHLLESLFWPISLSDELILNQSQVPQVLSFWENDAIKATSELPAEKENLVFRAMAKAQCGSFKIVLKKRIPMGAGLGGGSSNAGTFLRWLIAQNPTAEERLKTLAISLGADVPYFLNPCPSWVTGIGENRLPLNIGRTNCLNLFFLLIFPPEPLPTQSVFSLYRVSQKPFSMPASFPLDPTTTSTGLVDYLRTIENDLEDAASQLVPRIHSILGRLRQENVLCAGMTGSGSTCYAVFFSAAEREKSTKVLQPFLRENFCRSLTAESYFAS